MFQKFQLVALLALCAAPAHAHPYEPNDPPEGTVYDGFHCTTVMGVVMQSNLPESCAEWWPGCARKPDPPHPGKKCPGYCKRAYFKVRFVPIEGSDPYIHHHHYSSHAGSSNYSTTKYEGNSGSGSGKGKGGSESYGQENYGKDGGRAGRNGERHDDSGQARGEGGEESAGPRMADGGAFSAGGKHAQAASSGPGRQAAASGEATSPGPAAGSGPAAPSAAGGRRPASLPAPGDQPMTLEQAMALAEKAGSRAGNIDFRAEAEASGPTPEGGRAKQNYSDPWLDYIQGASRAELVEKLERDAGLRGELRRKIDEMADGSGASDPGTREKVDYYRRALAEAEARLKQGGLKALQPLEIFEQEAFAMNGDETEREIKRLLAGMDEKASGLDGDEGLHYPLFSRVHRSLWRQVANGNIVLKAKKR